MMGLSEVLETVVASLARLSAQAAVLVGLVALVQWVFRGRIGAKWRYLLWSLPFLRLMLPWSIPASFSLYTALRFANAEGPVHAPLQKLAAFAYRELSNGRVGAPLPTGLTDGLSPWMWLAAVWLAGLVAMLWLSLRQMAEIRRRAVRYEVVTDESVLALLTECKDRMGVHARVKLLATSDGVGPALLGFFCPRVLLPQRTLLPESRAHLRYILFHELAHLKRRDILAGWVTHLVLCAHWFNPILWWAKRRCTADRELACDAEVLSSLDGTERRLYGHALLDQVQSNRAVAWSPGLAGVLEGTTTVERRIAMIAEFRATTWANAAAGIALLAILGATALTDAKVTPLRPEAEYPAGSGETVAVADDGLASVAKVEPGPGTSSPSEMPDLPSLSEGPSPTELLDADWRSMVAGIGAAESRDTKAVAPPIRTNELKSAGMAGETPHPVKVAERGSEVKSTGAPVGKKDAPRTGVATQAKAKNGAPAPVANDVVLALFSDQVDQVREALPSRVRQRVESNLARRSAEPVAEGGMSTARTVQSAKSEPVERVSDIVERDTKSGAASTRPKKIWSKIGTTLRSVRNVLGGDGSTAPVGRGDRFDPAFVGSIVGPAANGGNSSLVPAAEPVRGVEVTMSFTRPSLRSIPKVEWGFAEGIGVRAAS